MIKKKCPKCGNNSCEIKGIITIKIIEENIIKHISLNDWKCLTCKKTFQVPRKGNKKEQELVQKFIDASKIILAKDIDVTPKMEKE